MGENELYQIAFHFREAIVAAKTNGEFNFRDRMHRFPGGCCDDTCDLLGFYLWGKYRIHTSQRNGYYEAEMTNHAWLITDARIIIDITGDQFYGAWKSVYVGQEVGTYKKLSRIITQDNFDIRKQSRLWDDYNIILKYLKKGGRITPAAAAIGTVLNLKPVLQIQGEKLDAYAKVRGKKQAKRAMLKAMKNDWETRFKEYVSDGEMCLQAAYTGNLEEAEEFKREIQEVFPGMEIHMDPLSLSVACHIGYGALAVACSRKVTL
mgnify:FL=1